VPEYVENLNTLFSTIIKKYRIPACVPARLYRDILDRNDLVVVMLEQINYLLRLRNQRAPYGMAAWSISQIKEPLSTVRSSLPGLKGVGKSAIKIVREILDTGGSSYYNQLLNQ
jgi:DNA polymerase/3'-5' exonuclease PolX